MDLEGGGITVVAVLADEALESEAEKEAGVVSCGPSRGISWCGCAPPDDGSEEDDGGEGSRAALSLVVERLGFACLVLFSDDGSSQARRVGVWPWAPVKDADGLRGLAAGRGVWWAWDSRSRDRLTDRLW